MLDGCVLLSIFYLRQKTMKDEEKIKLLLKNNDAKNNYLALQLMVNVLNIELGEAIQKIRLTNEAFFIFSLSILDVKIVYKYSENKYLFQVYGINRKVYVHEELIKKLDEVLLNVIDHPPKTYQDKVALVEQIKNEDLLKIAPQIQAFLENTKA